MHSCLVRRFDGWSGIAGIENHAGQSLILSRVDTGDFISIWSITSL